MTHELLTWVKTAHPYWNRTGGADHVWHFAHDEGACWAPTEVYRNSIMLTHWGRLDREHTSGTSYGPVSGLFVSWFICMCAGLFAPCASGPVWPPFACLQTSFDRAFPALYDGLHSSSQDDYSKDVLDDPFVPGGFARLIKGHPCHTPGKDLVLPSFESPERWAHFVLPSLRNKRLVNTLHGRFAGYRLG